MTDSQPKISQLVSYLRQMRLPVMADTLRELYQDPNLALQSTDDILEQIIMEEFLNRRSNTIQRHLKQAKLSQPNARLEGIDYSPERRLNTAVFDQLKTCVFIEHHRNVIVQGATGTGKSYIANALCRYVIEQGYTAYYTRMIELLSDLYFAEVDGMLPRLLKRFAKVDVLVIDDFLLTTTTEHEQKYLMEVFELRSRDKTLILASQMSTAEWHKKLGGGAIADAILDRAISNSYHVFIGGDSLRQQSGSN